MNSIEVEVDIESHPYDDYWPATNFESNDVILPYNVSSDEIFEAQTWSNLNFNDNLISISMPDITFIKYN